MKKYIYIKKKSRPTDPNFFWHVTGTTHICFLALDEKVCLDILEDVVTKERQAPIIQIIYSLDGAKAKHNE